MALSKKFKLTQLVKATADLDDAVKYYNSKQHGVGIKFYLEYRKTLKSIKLIHYTIDTLNRLVLIEAVICAYQDPNDAYIKK